MRSPPGDRRRGFGRHPGRDRRGGRRRTERRREPTVRPRPAPRGWTRRSPVPGLRDLQTGHEHTGPATVPDLPEFHDQRVLLALLGVEQPGDLRDGHGGTDPVQPPGLAALSVGEDHALVAEITQVGIDGELGGRPATQPCKIRFGSQGKKSGQRRDMVPATRESPALEGVLEVVQRHGLDVFQPAEPAELKQACAGLGLSRRDRTSPRVRSTGIKGAWARWTGSPSALRAPDRSRRGCDRPPWRSSPAPDASSKAARSVAGCEP